MTEITNFTQKHALFGQLRGHMDESNNPWFVAADVCRALAIANPRDAVARLDADDKGVATNDTLGGLQEMNIINESGLYSLILTSRKEEAKVFKKWVTAEVLPSIRKTGSYTVAVKSKAQLYRELADIEERAEQLLLESSRKSQVITQQRATLTAQQVFIDMVSKSNDEVLFFEFVKLLLNDERTKEAIKRRLIPASISKEVRKLLSVDYGRTGEVDDLSENREQAIARGGLAWDKCKTTITNGVVIRRYIPYQDIVDLGYLTTRFDDNTRAYVSAFTHAGMIEFGKHWFQLLEDRVESSLFNKLFSEDQ